MIAFSLTGLFILAYLNQEQQIHGHRQINPVSERAAMVTSKVGKWLVHASEMSPSSESRWKCFKTGSYFVAIVWLFHFTNTPIGFQTEKRCARVENDSGNAGTHS